MIDLVTDDSIAIRAGHYRSDGRVAAVMAHGFSSRQTNPKMVRLAGELAANGIDVFTFDFRGHGLSAGVSSLGGSEIEDTETIVSAARRQGFERIVSVGASMGGAVAIRHAARYRNVDGVVSISAPSGLHQAELRRARVMSYFITTRTGRALLRRLGGTRFEPSGDPVPVTEVAPAVAPIPVCVIHGRADPYIPLRDAHEIYDALEEPKRLIELDTFGHAEAAFDPEFTDLLSAVIEEPAPRG